MSVISTTFVLTGPLAGKTINLGSLPYPFREGRMTLSGPAEDMGLHARFLERNWQAYPVGHPALEEVPDGERDIQTDSQQDGQPPVRGDVQSEGDGAEAGEQREDDGGGAADTATREGEDAAGDGQTEGVTEPVADIDYKLQRAVMSLDPADDNQWTKDGKPAMTAVEKVYGSAGITRADVEAAAPGHTRDKAKSLTTTEES